MDISEYGDIMINTVMDEWGRVRINSLLEDGTKIIIISGGQVYEIYVDATAQTLASHSEQTTFNIEKNASVTSQITTLNFELGIPKDAVVQTVSMHSEETAYNIIKDAIVNALTDSAVQSIFNLSPEAVVRVLAEVSVVKEGEVKVTKLFLILGNLAIQIQDN